MFVFGKLAIKCHKSLKKFLHAYCVVLAIKNAFCCINNHAEVTKDHVML